MSSGGPTQSTQGGGILRSRPKGKGGDGGAREGHASGRVTFSTNGNDDDGGGRGSRIAAASRTPTLSAVGDGGYDSDEVEDALLASGEALSIGRKHGGGEEDVDMDDAAVRTAAEVEEAKRRRGRVRRRDDGEGGAGEDDLEKDDMDDHDGRDKQGLSLITDQNLDPDSYESNAGGNAECPVEPFNMEAERDGGLGYFDGDTYVFRQNKAVDGEEDAWLDGFGDDEGKEAVGVGGLDSNAVWKPSEAANKGATQKRKAKFVSEDAIPEDLGRRVATLLQKDDETVMAALTRHGAAMRELKSQEQKMTKKAKLKKRKATKPGADEGGSSQTANDAGAELKQLKRKIVQARETVEELSELADALLFGGETDAYELTRTDWIHRFKLEQYFPSSQKKRPAEADVGDGNAKKKSRGYFEGAGATADAGSEDKPDTTQPQHTEPVMWEYRGNEDGAIHGPYTSKQMLDWTSCGYFVGESAVDIRRVGSGGAPGDDAKPKKEEEAKVDVDDLMADLMDDDDEGEAKEAEDAGKAPDADSSWLRSDSVDFSLYL